MSALRSFVIVALLALVVGILPAPAAAQQFHLEHDMMVDGEPTDPDGAAIYVEANDIDLGAYGIGDAPQEESAIDSWLEAVLNVLYSLGLISSGDSD